MFWNKKVKTETSGLEMKNQLEKASKLYGANPNLAIRIAMGEETVSNGILSAAVYAKVWEEAEKSNNLDMMMQIANALHNSEISAESQKLEFRNPDSAIEKMKEVVNARREALEKALPKGKTYEMVVEEEIENIKKTMNESKSTVKDVLGSLGADNK